MARKKPEAPKLDKAPAASATPEAPKLDKAPAASATPEAPKLDKAPAAPEAPKLDQTKTARKIPGATKIKDDAIVKVQNKKGQTFSVSGRYYKANAYKLTVAK